MIDININVIIVREALQLLTGIKWFVIGFIDYAGNQTYISRGFSFENALKNLLKLKNLPVYRM